MRLRRTKVAKGYLLLCLHAHLPFVRHPEFPFFLEEQWLYEAILETYIPLLQMMHNLERDGVPFRLSMSITPTLCAMLSDDLLQQRFRHHLHQLIELAEKEAQRVGEHSAFTESINMYRRKLGDARRLYEDRYHSHLLQGFKQMQDSGQLEIITCGATHGFLPLMELYPAAVRAQVATAANDYQRHFGRKPQGIWLPECAYYPGSDQILKESGIRYFFAETHAVLHGNRRPKFGIFAPAYCPSGVATFSRDTESGKAVWSAEEGYPGDFRYREFYRDIGWDLPMDYIKDYIHPDGIRLNTGLKYYKITGKGNHKEPYSEREAWAAADSHAANFVFNRGQQISYLDQVFAGERMPLITSPYDAELYGHWWYEGPTFLEQVFRHLHYDQDIVKPITAPEYLKQYPANQVLVPSQSTWGNKGFNEVWLEGSNDWIYKHLHMAAEHMIGVAQKFQQPSAEQERVLKQMARELLLAQSSDWAFIMKTGTHVEYAVKRTHDHLDRFHHLNHGLHHGIDFGLLHDCESKDNLFPLIDYRVYQNNAPLKVSA